MNFNQKLKAAENKNQSLLCVGLDPDPYRIPEGLTVAQFSRRIIEATCDLVSSYKINFAFFERMGIHGWHLLEQTRRFVPDGIPVIADSKRADIGNTSRSYASAIFEKFEFDAVTLPPYMGFDSLSPFIDYSDRGVFVLCLTSNPGASDFQTVTCIKDGKKLPLYRLVAQKVEGWNTQENLGLVIGATRAHDILQLRNAHPEMRFLIPGVGPQGGDLETAVTNGLRQDGSGIIISSSRQVIHASSGPDFAPSARQAAMELRDRINKSRPESSGR